MPQADPTPPPGHLPMSDTVAALTRYLAQLVHLAHLATSGDWAVTMVLRHKKDDQAHLVIGEDRTERLVQTCRELEAATVAEGQVDMGTGAVLRRPKS